MTIHKPFYFPTGTLSTTFFTSSGLPSYSELFIPHLLHRLVTLQIADIVSGAGHLPGVNGCLSA